MNKKHMVILVILIIIVSFIVAFAMGSISNKSIVLMNNEKKSIGDNHYASLSQYGNTFSIGTASENAWGSNYKVTEAKVFFTSGGKTIIKLYDANEHGMIYNKKIPNGYTLQKAEVFYEKA